MASRPEQIACNQCTETMQRTYVGCETDYYTCPNGHKLGVCFRYSKPRCGSCSMQLSTSEQQWPTGLCNACYDSQCSGCRGRLSDAEKAWNTRMCNRCYDQKAATMAV